MKFGKPRSSDEKVVVTELPGLEPADQARLQLSAAAVELHQRAANAHARGMYFEGQSVRLEQLVELLEDESLVAVRDTLVDEGVLEIEASVLTTAKGGSS